MGGGFPGTANERTPVRPVGRERESQGVKNFVAVGRPIPGRSHIMQSRDRFWGVGWNVGIL